jgi:hypothetical protein
MTKTKTKTMTGKIRYKISPLVSLTKNPSRNCFNVILMTKKTNRLKTRPEEIYFNHRVFIWKIFSHLDVTLDVKE